MFLLLLQALKLLFLLLIDHVGVLQRFVGFEFDEFLEGKFAQFDSGMGSVVLMIVIVMVVAVGPMHMWLWFGLVVIMVAVRPVLMLVLVLVRALVIVLMLVLVIAFAIFAAEESDLLSHRGGRSNERSGACPEGEQPESGFKHQLCL